MTPLYPTLALVIFLTILSFPRALAIDDTSEIKKAVLRSCSGWKLNRLPKVKDFIREDAAKFNLPVEYVGGDPRLVFFDQSGTELKVLDVSQMDRNEIKKVLENHGFKQGA